MEDGEEEELNTKKPSGSYSTSEQGEQAPPAYAAGSVRSEPADAGKGGKRNDDNKKANRCALIVAIFGLLFALAAIVPTVFCHLLWWYWVWTLTTPALFFGFIGLILAAVKKREAASCCAGFAIVLGLAAIVWGSFEVIQANSYQGKLEFEETKTFALVDADNRGVSKFNPDMITDGGEISWKFQSNASTVSSLDDDLMKAFHYHVLGRYCKGRAYDWNYRKTKFADEIKCNRKTEKWFMHQFLKVTGSRYVGCATNQAFEGVDTYTQSPVYLTHSDINEAKKYVYASKDLKKEKQKELDEYCKDFKVEKFKEARKKCDTEIKSTYEPLCKTENGELMFTKGFKGEIEKIKTKKPEKPGKTSPSWNLNIINSNRKEKQLEQLKKGDCGAMLITYKGFAVDEEGSRIPELASPDGYVKKMKKAKPIYKESKYESIFKRSIENMFANAKFEFTKTKEVDGDEVKGPGQQCTLTDEEEEKRKGAGQGITGTDAKWKYLKKMNLKKKEVEYRQAELNSEPNSMERKKKLFQAQTAMIGFRGSMEDATDPVFIGYRKVIFDEEKKKEYEKKPEYKEYQKKVDKRQEEINEKRKAVFGSSSVFPDVDPDHHGDTDTEYPDDATTNFNNVITGNNNVLG